MLQMIVQKMPTKATSNSYRSGLEKRVANYLTSLSVPVIYETDIIPYVIPEKECSYTPDFKLWDNSYLEIKGWLRPTDRVKMLNVKRCNPNVVIKFAFQNPETKIARGSKTSYGSWATNHDFPWCWADNIPVEWLINPNEMMKENIDEKTK